MLYRKISERIENHLKSDSGKVLVIDGARQVGKSFIIRHIGKKLFKNYIEINFLEDLEGEKLFQNVSGIKDFYLKLSMVSGDKMGSKGETLVFLDEIQTYPQYLTLLKFLKQDDRFTYIASGSELGITLKKTTSIPIGSIERVHMYPLDFEEFLYANGFNESALQILRAKFDARESLDINTHNTLMGLFKKYLLTGGLPDVVNSFLEETNIVKVRGLQREIREYYGDDACKYDVQNKLKIKRIYDMIPSALGNKKKRIVIQSIENIDGKSFKNYQDEFDYLINSGIALEVKAITTPVFPLLQSGSKNLLKLYLNDVGLLSEIYYGTNVQAVLSEVKSINLGTIYENVVACELKAHGYELFYYDNNKNGEVDFLIDDYNDLSATPIEVKSGKDYTTHSALDKFLANSDYNIKKGYVLSDEREIKTVSNIIYLPIYFVMFFGK